ncbi:MAG: tRNA (guanine(10)-N(2))-dimethyltransferase [Candidatus Helarchaeota archaeon]
MSNFTFPLVPITEGKARIQIPDQSQYRVPTEAPVFFNFRMELNRDISILAVETYQEIQNQPLTILLPLAATGVRGIRFQFEIGKITKILMNDASPEAYRLMGHNLKLNDLFGIIEIYNDNALNFLNRFAKRGQRVDVIDIDPFGSPSRFLDSAVRALKRNSGMICLTATDMAPLCGVNTEACLRKYGGRPLRTEYCHELAVRLCFNALITTAAKYEIAIYPLLSYSADHYVRVYARLESGALKVDETLKYMGFVVHCFQCGYRTPTTDLLRILPTCPNCGASLDYAGPLWLGPLNDPSFCKQLLEKNTQKELGTKKRIGKLLTTILQEDTTIVSYQNIHRICRQHKINSLPLDTILQTLCDHGFSATRTHFSNISIRTTATRAELTHLIKQLMKKS